MRDGENERPQLRQRALARNLFEKAIQRQANCLSAVSNPSPRQLTELTTADLEHSFE